MVTVVFCMEVVVALLLFMELSGTVTWAGVRHTEKAVVEVVPTHQKSSEFTRRHPGLLGRHSGIVNIRITTNTERYNLRVQRNTRVEYNQVPVLTINGSENMASHKSVQVGEFYQSEDCECFFVVKFPEEGDHTGRVNITGTFYRDGYSYFIQRLTGSKGHVITKQPITQQHDFNSTSGRSRDSKIEELPMMNPGRRPRQVQLYRIELLVAVDFSIYDTWRNRLLTSDVTSPDVVMDQIIQYYSLVVNAIDARFSSIAGSGYTMDVVLAGIYIAENATLSPWTERTKLSSNPTKVTGDSLQKFSDWLKQYKDQQPIKFDHAMAFTSYNLVHSGNEKTLGLAFQQSMCTDRSYSLIEDGGNIAYVSYIAAHELSHSLGAKHDGEPVTVKYGDVTKSCDVTDGYLMMPRTSKAPSKSIDGHLRSWKLSECSVLYFDFYIDHLSRENNNCLTLTATSPVTDSHPVHAQNKQLQLHPDAQCELAIGHGSYMLRTIKDPASICRRIPCADPTRADVQIPILTMEGTICGFKKFCQAGRCVDVDAYSDVSEDVHMGVDSACRVFGDHPGQLLSGTTRQTCSDLLPYQCYSYDTECCHACAAFRRDYTLLPGCHYGDRKKHCLEQDCSLDLGVCCETCAILHGNLSVCPSLQQPKHGSVTTNTGTTYHGAVATFSCHPGYSVHGNKSKTCLVTGEWSSDDPVCVYGCLTLRARRYSVFSVNDDGTTATFKCKHGLILQGTETLYCRNDSTWSDYAPYCTLQFTSADRIHINENVSPGSRVHRLSTGQADARFSLIGYSSPGFDVSDDGDVIVSEGADVNFERVQIYTLYLQTTSVLDKRFRAKQLLTIHVLDVNEFPPEFTLASYCVEIDMVNDQDVVTLGINAIDPDIANTNISYVLIGNDKIAQCISLDSAISEIRIASKEMLRELGHGRHVLTVHAVDSGQPWQRTGTCVVDICVGIPCGSIGVHYVTSLHYVVLLLGLMSIADNVT